MKAACQKLGGNDVRIRIDRDVGGYLLDYLYYKKSLSKLQDELRNRAKWDSAAFISASWGYMQHKKTRKKIGTATRASVKKEMARPCMAKSARIAERNLDPARVPEQPSITMPGTVDKIIPSPRPSQPEKAHIAVDGADQRYRNLRIENTLIDENGDDLRLKKGARVEVTVTADLIISTATINKGGQLTRSKKTGLGFGRHNS